jgi:hypothetical protein
MTWPPDAKGCVIGLTVLLTVIVTICYALKCRGETEATKKFDVAVVVEITANSAGVIIGGLLVLSIFFPALQQLVADSWLYIFISGLVVMIVSGMSLSKRAGWAG